MLTYVSLFKWTAQGIKNVKDTTKRAAAAQAGVEKAGGRLVTLLWTQGRYDLISIAEFPDEDTAMAWTVSLAMQGNVSTETLRAFSAADVDRILSKVS
jgi:uncharacterized protein with GYD domain